MLVTKLLLNHILEFTILSSKILFFIHDKFFGSLNILEQYWQLRNSILLTIGKTQQTFTANFPRCQTFPDENKIRQKFVCLARKSAKFGPRLRSKIDAAQPLWMPIDFMDVSSSALHLMVPIQSDDDSRLCISNNTKKNQNFIVLFKSRITVYD